MHYNKRAYSGLVPGSFSFRWVGSVPPFDKIPPPLPFIKGGNGGICLRQPLGDLKKPESAIGTGPFLLERYEPPARGSPM